MITERNGETAGGARAQNVRVGCTLSVGQVVRCFGVTSTVWCLGVISPYVVSLCACYSPPPTLTVITEMERLLNTFCDLHISPFHNGYFSVGLVCGEHVMTQVPGLIRYRGGKSGRPEE